MLNTVRKFVPYSALSFYRKLKRKKQRIENSSKSTEEVFTDIYRTNHWGGESGEFCSGTGTVNEAISEAYIKCLADLQSKYQFSDLNVVDLGCGDMRIGSQLAGLFATYTGVDIVKEMIEKHASQYTESTINFKHLNIVEDELPDGDVCLIRQVLQHLSNDQIVKILSKLSKYKYVFITEQLPTPNDDLKFNLDKSHGGDVRLYDNSGIYLTEAPFNLDKSLVTTVLEVEGHGYQNYSEPWIKGVIETVLYTPKVSED